MSTVPSEIYTKHQRLQRLLAGVGRSVIGFSGGTSSSLLAWVAAEEVGRAQLLAVIVPEAGLTPEARAEAEQTARRLRLPYRVLEGESACGHHGPASRLSRYGRLAEIQREKHYASLLDGCHADAIEDTDAGYQPAQEFGVRSPLAEVGLGAVEVQALARALGLIASTPPVELAPTPPPPLSSTSALMAAEAYLRSLGFRHARIWRHGELARIEVGPEEVPWLTTVGVRLKVTRRLRELGFPHATIARPTVEPAQRPYARRQRFSPQLSGDARR